MSGVFAPLQSSQFEQENPCCRGGGTLAEDRVVRPREAVLVDPVLVVSQSFPARPSSLPEIRDFVQRNLAEAPLTGAGAQELREAILAALLEAAGPEDRAIQVSFRFLPDMVEVDVLHTPASPADLPVRDRGRPEDRPFADWLAGMLRREGSPRRRPPGSSACRSRR